MKPHAFLVIALLSGISSLHAASVLQVDLTAAGSSRFYDYFSDAFAQLDRSPQGMWNISNPSQQLGSDVNGFANGGVWNNLGTLTLDGDVTGTGTEIFNIAAVSGFDFDPVISGSVFAIAGGGYSTTFGAFSGTVTLTGGIVTSLNFTGDIAFTFPGYPSQPFDGMFTLTESSFDLLVDDFLPSPAPDFFPDIRQVWDVDGTAAFAVVPEPSAALLGSLGLLPLLRRR